MQVPIIGMDCPSCALSIEKEVKKLPGVKRINVNVTTGNAFVEFDPSTVRTTEIIDAIKSAGYRTGKATLRLGIKGMYCASCVTKIEDELRRTPGVLSADVNLATESATIEYLSSNIKISDVKKVIYSLGYEVIEPEGRSVPPQVEDQDETELVRRQEYRTLMRKFIFAAAISVPVVIFSYPSLFGLPSQVQKGTEAMRYISMMIGLITLPVMFWSGSQFFTGMWAAFKNRSANMNTLVATGVSAAWLYSTVAVLFPSIFPKKRTC
ncbi:MAG: copper ion binding protein [Bacteroidota bacterium]